MKYFIIAGEASGDLHASKLMRELKLGDPDAQFCFLGGDLMRAEGGVQIKDYREMSFMGFISVVKNIKKIKQNFIDCKQALVEFQPNLVILVDYPGFNLRIARFVREQMHIPVYYYISPKVWAWKECRVRSIKRDVDRMFTILPFETEFYAKHNFYVEYVGNPSVDSIAERPKQNQTIEEFWILNRLPQKPIIAILPGSRKQEIKGCLPTSVKSAKPFSDYQIVVAGAPGVEPDFYSSILKDPQINVVFDQTSELLQCARVAIVNSGTATLEAALIGTPQIVVYHVFFGRLAYLLKKIFIHVKFVSLVNLIAEKEIVKEFIAYRFTPANITFELKQILRNADYRETMIQNYSEVKKKLGDPGAAKKTAKKILKYLRHKS